MKRISYSINENNCLNTIRLLAAIRILYRHSTHYLCYGLYPFEIYLTDIFDGVPIFLTLSGYLIWTSIGRSQSFNTYLKKRFWRIFPELWCAVLFEIFCIIIFYTGHINWLELGLFTITQGTIFQFWEPTFLYGYGSGTPNGALWTISVLIQFYIIAYFIYKILHNKRIYAWALFIASTLLLGYCTPKIITHIPYPFNRWYMQSIFPYLWLFLISSFVAEKKEIILPITKKYWLILIIWSTVFYSFELDLYAQYNIIQSITLFLGLLGIAYSYPGFNIKTDISYGIYIYHMSIVNVFIFILGEGNRWHVLLSILITIFIAIISTKTIGNWAHNKKKPFTTNNLS